MRTSAVLCLPCLVLLVGVSAAIHGQGFPVISRSQDAATRSAYPDSRGGLGKFASEVLQSLKKGDAAKTRALLEGLLLPDPSSFFSRLFPARAAEELARNYEGFRAQSPAVFEELFRKAEAFRPDGISVARFERSCDDNAGEFTFGILQSRLEPIPLYELRFHHADEFLRLFAFAYVDGGFRYLGDLRPSKLFERSARRENPPAEVPVNVQSAKLIQKVQPEYPDIARKERLQGTVRIHALIGKDGVIYDLVVIRGACSLAESAVEAVRQWRYRPTLLNNQPVEIDTYIDVIYTLGN